MYCYEKFLPELQTEVFVLACDSKKLCRNGRVLSVSAQLNEFNLYYSELLFRQFRISAYAPFSRIVLKSLQTASSRPGSVVRSIPQKPV